jgi:hypothetical protein
MTTSLKQIMDDLAEQLGDRQLFTLKQLIEIGLFGNMASARKALSLHNRCISLLGET